MILSCQMLQATALPFALVAVGHLTRILTAFHARIAVVVVCSTPSPISKSSSVASQK